MDKPISYVLPDFTLPPFEIKSQILQIKSSLVQNAPVSKSGLKLADALSSFYGDVIRRAWKRTFTEAQGVMLMGLGSFGRREMNIFSDIDIQVVYETASAANLPDIREGVSGLVKFLWDIGVEIGHSLRSADDCVHLVRTDPDIKTSFLENRFIDGEAAVFRNLMERFYSEVFSMNREEYVSQRIELMNRRHEKHGHSERVLEPHVKDGVGALRDVHTALWLWRIRDDHAGEAEDDALTTRVIADICRKGWITRHQQEAFLKAFDQVLIVRNVLHSIHNRRMDVLDYASQSKVAKRLGYADEKQSRGVELFMREFYAHLTLIRRTCALIINKLLAEQQSDGIREPIGDGFCLFRDETSNKLSYEGDFLREAIQEPNLRLKVFRYAIENGAGLEAGLEAAFREGLDEIDDTFCRSRSAAKEFLELWRFEGSVGRMLTWMHRLGFLERYLPEFGYIVSHYNYNVYHRYTTDEHLLVAVNKLEEIFFNEYPEGSGLHHLKTVYDELSLFEKYQLYWAVFLHDIGKGRTEDHCLAGVKLARDIFERIGFPESREAVYSLIEYHLKMEQTAFRRNLKDPDAIHEFAALIKDRRVLRMLYLLTYADMSAANTSVWTEWKAVLLQELFLKTDGVLRQREESSESHHTAFDWEMAESKGVIMDRPLKVLFNDGSNYTEVLVMTTDRPYRLCQICGAMAVNDVSIFEANVHTRTDGIIADQFRVVGFPEHRPLDATQKERLSRDLEEALIGEKDLTGGIQRLQSRWKRIKISGGAETEVLFDENRTFTIIDIFTTDRIGLLYLITKTLSDLRLNIFAAKIGTRLDGVADCFYVLEQNGKKLIGPERQREVRQRLTTVLGPAMSV